MTQAEILKALVRLVSVLVESVSFRTYEEYKKYRDEVATLAHELRKSEQK